MTPPDFKRLAEEYAGQATSLNPRTQWHMLKFRIARAAFLDGVRAGLSAAADAAERWEQFPALEVAGQIRALSAGLDEEGR